MFSSLQQLHSKLPSWEGYRTLGEGEEEGEETWVECWASYTENPLDMRVFSSAEMPWESAQVDLHSKL